eukprot:Pgem_evm1s7301
MYFCEKDSPSKTPLGDVGFPSEFKDDNDEIQNGEINRAESVQSFHTGPVDEQSTPKSSWTSQVDDFDTVVSPSENPTLDPAVSNAIHAQNTPFRKPLGASYVDGHVSSLYPIANPTPNSPGSKPLLDEDERQNYIVNSPKSSDIANPRTPLHTESGREESPTFSTFSTSLSSHSNALDGEDKQPSVPSFEVVNGHVEDTSISIDKSPKIGFVSTSKTSLDTEDGRQKSLVFSTPRSPHSNALVGVDNPPNVPSVEVVNGHVESSSTSVGKSPTSKVGNFNGIVK